MEGGEGCRRLRAAGFLPAEWAVVLGTGLSQSPLPSLVKGGKEESPLVEGRMERSLPFSALPGFWQARVAGHPGRVEQRRYGGARALVFAGRNHLYEGGGLAAVLASVRLAVEWGVSRLLLVSAVGAISPAARAHPFVFLSDYLIATPDAELAGVWELPAAGSGSDGVHPVFDPSLTAGWFLAAQRLGLRACRGVYAFCRGPQYETRAEIGVLDSWGADVVGMSMVPEAIAARRSGLAVVGLAVTTNLATGLGATAHDHPQVAQSAAERAPQVAQLIAKALGND